MDTLLVNAIVFITMALVFYTIGVWSEHKQGVLKKWHLLMFMLGLICDSLGTSYMSQIAGGFKLNLHGITGLIAIVLMLVHAVWAAFVLFKNNEKQKLSFHKFSVLVWFIWLVPYILGMIIGMSSGM